MYFQPFANGPLLCMSDNRKPRISEESMTFDWQVLVAACGAISLRLVAIGSNPEVVRALDEQLHQKPDGRLSSLQDQAGSKANDFYSPDRSDLKFPTQQ